MNAIAQLAQDEYGDAVTCARDLMSVDIRHSESKETKTPKKIALLIIIVNRQNKPKHSSNKMLAKDAPS